MPDFLFCTAHPRRPDLIRITGAHDDPRSESVDGRRLRREAGGPILWTLRVVDYGLSADELTRALRRYRERSEPGYFACDPMEARGEAIKITTLRPADDKRRKRGLLGRLLPRVRRRAA